MRSMDPYVGHLKGIPFTNSDDRIFSRIPGTHNVRTITHCNTTKMGLQNQPTILWRVGSWSDKPAKPSTTLKFADSKRPTRLIFYMIFRLLGVQSEVVEFVEFTWIVGSFKKGRTVFTRRSLAQWVWSWYLRLPNKNPEFLGMKPFLAGLLTMFAIQWLGCKPNTAPNNATKNKQSQTSVLHYSRVVISTQREDTQLSKKCSRLKISSPIANNTVAS